MMRNRITVIAVGLFAAAGAMLALGGPASASVTPMISQGDAANQLSNAGITWSSSGGCTDRNNSTCTSFEGIQQSTVSGAITLHNASGCAENITGGTEVGHAGGTYSHGTGYKIDISHNSCIDNYIHTAFTHIGNRAGDNAPQWQAGSGNLYADEGSHWDIVFYTCGC
jgi:hypothetical protein